MGDGDSAVPPADGPTEEASRADIAVVVEATKEALQAAANPESATIDPGTDVALATAAATQPAAVVTLRDGGKADVEITVDAVAAAGAVAAPDVDVPTLQTWAEPRQTGQRLKPAKSQIRLNGDDVSAEFWGITQDQCQDLLDELRAEPLWRSTMNLYEMVEEYIKPWTLGKGTGYALLINGDCPKEVNLMVSHCWCENAEVFLEDLVRSTSKHDVMFICALSLYQCEDGAGPSIQEQLGEDAKETPFGKVLSNIRSRGIKDGWRWKWRPYLLEVPKCLWFAAMACFFYSWYSWGCVPSYVDWQCARRQVVDDGSYFTYVAGDRLAVWSWEPLPSNRAHHSLPLSLFFAVCAIGFHGMLWRYPGYSGRMMVVPNREGDIYTRLWCVYEIWIAKTIGIPIDLACTLAYAGASQSRKAVCSSIEDQRRIRDAIEEKDGDKGYVKIDYAVFITTRTAQRSAALTMIRWGTPLLLLVQAHTCVRANTNYEQQGGASFWGYVLCAVLGGAIVVTGLVYTFKREQGRPQVKNVCIYIGLLLGVGICLLYLGLRFVPWADRLSGNSRASPGFGAVFFNALFARMGALFVLAATQFIFLLAGAFVWLRLPSKFQVPHRRTITTVILFAVGMAFTANSQVREERSQDQWLPVLLFHSVFVLTYFCVPFVVLSTAALHWGVEVRGPGGASVRSSMVASDSDPVVAEDSTDRSPAAVPDITTAASNCFEGGAHRASRQSVSSNNAASNIAPVSKQLQ